MARLLNYIEVQSPDCCHQWGQTLLRPVSYWMGRDYRVEKNVEELPESSVAKRVMAALLSLLLAPITAVLAVVGSLLLTFSETHKRAYEKIEETKMLLVLIRGIYDFVCF